MVVRIEKKEDIVIVNTLTICVDIIQGRARKKHSKAAGVMVVPVTIIHFITVRSEPDDVTGGASSDAAALKELRTMQYRVLAANLNELLGEIQKF